MASSRVTGGNVFLATFDVVGQDGDELAFVGHVGLATSAGSQDSAQIPICEMRPPLHGRDAPGQMTADVVGSAALTDNEIMKITNFVDRHAVEHASLLEMGMFARLRAVPQMYIVHPHAEPYREEDGRYTRMRFSCAGFVLEAYRKARIRLLDTKVLPLADLEHIRPGYPTEFRLMENGPISPEQLGLEGDGPWRVLMCGYLFHALNRDAASVRSEPYDPRIEDRYFP
jgi:hypothetical protein